MLPGWTSNGDNITPVEASSSFSSKSFQMIQAVVTCCTDEEFFHSRHIRFQAKYIFWVQLNEKKKEKKKKKGSELGANTVINLFN